MLPLPLLLSLLSQAEAAPPEPEPPQAGPVDPAVDEVGLAAKSLSVAMGLGIRLPPASRAAPPTLGLSVATSFEHQLTSIGERGELGIAAGFAFARHTQDVQGSIKTASGGESPIDDVRSMSTYEFTLSPTVGLRLGRIHPWLSLGAGGGLAYFASREFAYRPGEQRLFGLVLVGAAGIDAEIRPATSVGVRFSYTRRATRRDLALDGGDAVLIFGDRVSTELSLSFRF